MTSRQRVVAALNHTEPDSTPIDLGGTMCSSLTRGANENLKTFLNLNTETETITNPLTDSVEVSEKILDLFQVDFRTVRMKGPEPQMVPADSPGIIRDEFGTIWKTTDWDYVPVVFSYANASVDDLKHLPKPDPYNPGRIKGVRAEAETLRDQTEFALIADFICGGPFEQAQRIRGFQQFLLDMVLDSKFTRALLDMLTENAIGFWDAMLSEVGDYVDVVCQGDDLGMQDGLMISPDMYRTLVKPCHKRIFDFIRSKTDACIWLHSCGSVFDIIPDFIEAGVQALNPVQTSAKDMEPERLKKEYGKEITFWGGGIDIQKLPFLTEEEVIEEVNRVLETMAVGGGYVFAASHNILPDTQGENIYAAYSTAAGKRN